MDRSLGGPSKLRPWPFFLDKWYVDVLLPGGDVLIAYVARLRLLGLPVGRFVCLWFPAGGPTVRVTGTTGAARFHASPAGPPPAELRLSWDLPGLAGDIRLVSRWPSISTAGPIAEAGGRFLHWHAHMPDAEATGVLRVAGRNLTVEGRGYVDRVRSDLLPWRFPVRAVRWGRAAGGQHASMWLSVDVDGGSVSLDWLDGQVGPEGAARPQVLERRLLADEVVVRGSTLELGAWRVLLRPWFGDLRQQRWAARAELAGSPVRAVLEHAEFG